MKFLEQSLESSLLSSFLLQSSSQSSSSLSSSSQLQYTLSFAICIKTEMVVRQAGINMIAFSFQLMLNVHTSTQYNLPWLAYSTSCVQFRPYFLILNLLQLQHRHRHHHQPTILHPSSQPAKAKHIQPTPVSQSTSKSNNVSQSHPIIPAFVYLTNKTTIIPCNQPSSQATIQLTNHPFIYTIRDIHTRTLPRTFALYL